MSAAAPAVGEGCKPQSRADAYRVRRGETMELPIVQATCELAGGAKMPVLGLGVWQMSAGRETEQAVEWALEAGYRHIDTASMYRNEQSVGAALRRCGLPRKEVFVTTKLMPGRPSAARELDKSLTRLGLDYVDLYLIHWPLPLANGRIWRQLESLQEGGRARAIGVSNFGRDRLARLGGSAARIPAVNQVQFSPYHYRRRLLEYCLEQGIVFEAYSPLARGRGLHDPTIAAVAERLDRTPAQVMLRWAIQHQAVVIPKSSRQERIRSNARLFDFELTDTDMQALDSLDRTNNSAQSRG
jgi:diketogulonate reductase-like aldo/keto reductase